MEYKEFVEKLELFCKQQKPVKIKAKKHLVTRANWGGIEFSQSTRLANLRNQLQQLTEKFATVEKETFDPHIALVYAKDLPNVYTIKHPL